jgi:hypothetical protein
MVRTHIKSFFIEKDGYVRKKFGICKQDKN